MSEQLPGLQYPTSALPSEPTSQQFPPISTSQSHAPSQSAPESLHEPSTPAPMQELHRATPEPNRKRARPTVSCFECRRKKLKCDRVQPCSQCVKSRREDLCQFATGVTKVGVNRQPQPLAAREDDGERAGKRMRIEDVMTPNSTPENGQAEENGRRDVSSSGPSLGRISVKGNRSRYLGVGDKVVMLDHFKDVKSYIVNSFKDPDTAGMMYELTRYQNSFQRTPEKSQLQLPHDRASLVTEMLKSLPTDESLLSSTLYLYETHWEGLTRVLHKPTFVQGIDAVQMFVQSRASGEDYSLPQHIRESIIPQILGVYVLSARLQKSMAKSTTDSQIALWMEMMQKWLDNSKSKERLNIETLRVQILLILCKMSNLIQNSDLWKESGTLARSAMIMGLHQDPESYEEFSVFEKEQRRKLWRTILELDMQFSLAGGMPAAIRSSDFNSRPLSKVDDSALKEDMAAYPGDGPERVNVWSDALPQSILSASEIERLDATNVLAGNVLVPEDYERLLGLARYFEYCLQGLPNQVSGGEYSGDQGRGRSPGRLFMKIMLDVALRRPTLSIYQCIMLSESSCHYPEARRGALRNAIAMLSHLDALDPELADPNIIKSRDQLNLFHVICKKDIIQSALTLCLEIQSFSVSSREGPGNRNGVQDPRDDLLPWTKTSLTRIVENTLNSLLQRLGEFGSDLKDILPVSIALQSARLDGSAEDKKLLMKKGTERVLKACQEALPHLPTAPAISHNDREPGTELALISAPLQELHNGNQNYNRNPFDPDPSNGHGNMNMLPSDDLSFEIFDIGFADWDISGSWSGLYRDSSG